MYGKQSSNIWPTLRLTESHKIRSPILGGCMVRWKSVQQSPTHRADKYHRARQTKGFVVSKEEERTYDEGESETASHMAAFWAAKGNLLAKWAHVWVLFSSRDIFQNMFCKFVANIETLEYLFINIWNSVFSCKIRSEDSGSAFQPGNNYLSGRVAIPLHQTHTLQSATVPSTPCRTQHLAASLLSFVCPAPICIWVWYALR